MRYRKLDANGDYTFGTGQDFWIDSADGVAQAVKTRLALFSGEWFLDTSDGTPWNTDVLGKYTRNAYDAAIRGRILGTDGVQAINDYASIFDGNGRLLSVAVTLSTIYGNASLAGPL